MAVSAARKLYITMATQTPATDSLYACEAKRGLKITLDPIREPAPVIAFDTKTPTDIDPNSFVICADHGVWDVDCGCSEKEK